MGSGEEDEDVSGIGELDGLAGEGGGLFPDGGFALGCAVAGGGGFFMGAVDDFHGVGAAVGLELADGCHVVGELVGFQSGGHDDEAEVGSGVFLDVEAAGEGEVHGEAAFVEFVEDDGGDAGEVGVFVEDALEDAVGEVEDAGFGRGFVVEADGVADGFAEWRVALGGDVASEEAGGHASGLDDEDAFGDLGEVGDEAGDFGGFS